MNDGRKCLETMTGDITLTSEEQAAIRWVLGEVDRLRAAIRNHRDQRGDDRCWLDDAMLYEAIGEPMPRDGSALPPKEDFLASCERYYEQRRCPLDVYPPGKMRIAELEAEVARLTARLAAIEAGRAALARAGVMPWWAKATEGEADR